MELFKHSSTGQFILNHEGIILKVNNAFKGMVNVRKNNDIISHKLSYYISDEDVGEFNTTLFLFLKNTKRSIDFNIRYRAGNECSWWKLSLDKVVVGDTFFLLGVAVDIGDEIIFQGNLLEAKKVAERSEASKSIFLANMSHEIRTPIHTVTGLAELLDDTELDSEQSEYVTQIEFAAKVLLTLINDILDFSKIEAGKLVFENIEYNLYETINNSVDLSALEAHKKGVDVAISMDRDMPMIIVGDQVRLRQIIVNLMSNAVKFTKEGEVVLDVHTKIIDDKKATLRISVTDSGIGISKEKQDKLFIAFSQADVSTTREFGGTGLGLSISSSLVQMMGGKMKVESEEGHGASFYFEIPVNLGAIIEPVFNNAPVENLKALVVDDNRKVNKIFSDMLRSWNYDVVETYTVMDALNELIIKATLGEPYDLCFIDQIIPGMDGWQLASEIHSNSLIKTTKTLLMSLKGKGIEESKMKLLGWFQGYLTKPVSRESLYHALNELYTRTMDVEMDGSLDDDDIEELESLGDDDEYMEPLTFSDHVYDGIEELEAVEEHKYIDELTDFKCMAAVTTQEEVEELHLVVPKTYDDVNILVVEDHIVNQKLFKIILEKSGYNVFVASDGLEAVKIVESEKLDIIFMDCQMPVMNGYNSSLAIRDKGYTLPIIAVTASAVKGEFEKCIDAGMSDVMTKPFKKDDVTAFLKKWLSKEE